MRTKQQLEDIFRNAGMRPEERDNIEGHEVFIADGFSSAPEFTYARFGAEKGDFPNGAYCTIWFAVKGEETLNYGVPMMFDKNHNPGLSESEKRQARINTAVKEATLSLKKYNSVVKEGLGKVRLQT